MTAFLLGVAAGLYLAIAIWWIQALWRDRRPRRGGESGATTASTGKGPAVIARPRRPCGAAGLDECTGTDGIHTGPPGQIRAGGPQT